MAAKSKTMATFSARQQEALARFDEEHGSQEPSTSRSAPESARENMPAGTSGPAEAQGGLEANVNESREGEEGVQEQQEQGQLKPKPKPKPTAKDGGRGVPNQKGDEQPREDGDSFRMIRVHAVPIPPVVPSPDRHNLNNERREERRPKSPLRAMKAKVPPPRVVVNTYRNSSREPMEVDRPTKRKRGEETEADDEDWEADEEEEDEEEGEGVKREQGETRRKRRWVRALPVPINKYYIPRCTRCERLNRTCQAQENAQACYICAKSKLGCKGAKGPKHDFPASAGDEEGERPNRGSARKFEKRKGKRDLLTSRHYY